AAFEPCEPSHSSSYNVVSGGCPMNGRLLILSLGAAVTLACDRGSPTASRLPSLHADAVGAVVVSAITDLGTLPGGGFSSAAAINNAGDVVGSSGGHPVLWHSDGSLVDLGTLPGSVGGGATAINDRGQVVGSSNFPDFVTVHAFLWQAGTMIDLGTLGGASSIALAINNAGQVVG